ncbi:hypothetical protein GCM10014713_29680 [Streptomyces purpureus]|uniref:HTH luxR-type domain-containing protein n=1 Tax=Streptomyces purpureus TaxID=1951 RepID=A0A918H3P5_9ACTN|nr:hypothetical protein GCM10014713_29680 [Streptomyces purpureus]
MADREQVTRILGAQLQESELQAKLTVHEALELYAACYPAPADWRTLAERPGLTDKLSTRFGKLSGGQKQRLFIALALVGDPRVVVLDELTTGLDPRAREREVLELVAKGTSNREIAAELFISEATVKTHLTHVYAKLGAKDRAAAVAVAYERKILG